MQAHYLQHVPFEGLGSIEPWLIQQGYSIQGTQLFNHDPLPNIDSVNLVIVLGGPMSVNDEAMYPWLKAEKAFIRQAIEHNKPILGICLGAQLIAASLGAKVYPNTQKEIGWFDIQAATLPNVETDVFQFPDSVQVFHWHGETFDLPHNAVHLAESVACKNQAFQLGERVIGLQFHLETTPKSAQDIIQHCADELDDSPYVQNAETLLNAPPQHYQTINRLMADILSFITQP